MQISKYILFGLLSLFLATLLEAAQGGVFGHIRDDAGSPLPGVTVQVQEPGGRVLLTVYSDRDGHYAAAPIPKGTYEIVYKLLNFTTLVKNNVQVDASSTSTVDVVLPLAVTAEIVVTGKRTFQNLAELDGSIEGLVGIADSSSQGTVTGEQLDSRPLMRPGDVLEAVPGLLVSQHSGEGKANQYYLRGFNLDHGTDFATWVAGIPVNLPTHAHGQGYTDVSFMIPELVSGVQYKKGPYFADEGDFSAAGAANINYTNSLDENLVKIDGGNYSYGRALFTGSPSIWNGKLLYALELATNDGAWDLDQNYRKYNGVLRYTQGDVRNGISFTGMFYRGDWDSTDQIPQRAVDAGTIGRFGFVDPTDGGETHRYSLSAQWQHTWSSALTQATGYFLDYKLNLFSNFTYFLDDPENGDQFEQADDRNVYGFHGSHRWFSNFAGLDAENLVGVQFRYDDINNVGLYKTRARQRLSTTREDEVGQQSVSVYGQTTLQLFPKVRSILGLRADLYNFDVTSNIPANSGDESDSLVSPKISIVLGPWKSTEYYFNYGYGFHSNDARGSTIAVDPITGEPAERVDPLVRAKGYEAGFRTAAFKRYQLTVSLWRLDIDSELLFVGDAGITEATRPSIRYGVEWANYYRPLSWLVLDADFAWSDASFSDDDPAGERIPGAVERVFSMGASVEKSSWNAGIRLRYFGPRPLIEDNSIRSDSSTLVNARIGYRFGNQWELSTEVFNLFNTKASDIDYFYTSRLPNEPVSGFDDIHTHPLEPTTFRIAISRSF
jgi:outer membrane receptor protein involved in Fe transport